MKKLVLVVVSLSAPLPSSIKKPSKLKRVILFYRGNDRIIQEILPLGT